MIYGYARVSSDAQDLAHGPKNALPSNTQGGSPGAGIPPADCRPTLSFNRPPSKCKCQVLPRTTYEVCNLEASIVRPQHAKHLDAVPHL